MVFCVALIRFDIGFNSRVCRPSAITREVGTSSPSNTTNNYSKPPFPIAFSPSRQMLWVRELSSWRVFWNYRTCRRPQYSPSLRSLLHCGPPGAPQCTGNSVPFVRRGSAEKRRLEYQNSTSACDNKSKDHSVWNMLTFGDALERIFSWTQNHQAFRSVPSVRSCDTLGTSRGSSYWRVKDNRSASYCPTNETYISASGM